MKYLKRQYFRRFLRPINRMRLTPDVVSRTVVVGLLWGLTATVGLQIAGVTLFWLVMRRLNRPFNLPVALVLTGVTNPLTVAPIYSLYYVVGCSAIPDCHPGAASVETLITRLNDDGFWSVLASSWKFLAITNLGSLPFAIAGCIAGHYFGRWIGRAMEERRRRRAEVQTRRRAERSRLAPGN